MVSCSGEKIATNNNQNVSPEVDNFLQRYHICLGNNCARKSENVYIFKNIYIHSYHIFEQFLNKQVICSLMESLLLVLSTGPVFCIVFFRSDIHPYCSFTL